MFLKTKAKILLSFFSLSLVLECIFPLQLTYAATPDDTEISHIRTTTIRELELLCDNYDNFPTEENRNNLSEALTRIDDSITPLNLFGGAARVTIDNICHALWIAHRCSSISENPVVQEHLEDYIIQNHINVNELDVHGTSLLHYAAFFGGACYHFMWALLERSNADINLQDINGNTPLHIAILSRQPFIIDVLLPFYNPTLVPEHVPSYARAHTDITNYEGLTPLDIAYQMNDTSILRCLAYRGAIQ